MTKKKSAIPLIIISSIACTLLTLGVLTGPVLSAQTDLPPRPTPTVPQTSPEPVVNGGHIILQTLFDNDWPLTGMNWQDLHTVVQWQDQLGDWHDVSGWQGCLDKVYASDNQIKGMKSWWVPWDLFGKGLFRWQVYISQDSELLVQSTDFDLPERNGQSVVVEVSLAP